MQTLTQLKIEEPERKESFLEILSDKYCRSILEAIMVTPKSAIEISREKIIPLSTVYRRIQQLHDSKMIRTSGVFTEEGKRLAKKRHLRLKMFYNWVQEENEYAS